MKIQILLLLAIFMLFVVGCQPNVQPGPIDVEQPTEPEVSEQEIVVEEYQEPELVDEDPAFYLTVEPDSVLNNLAKFSLDGQSVQGVVGDVLLIDENRYIIIDISESEVALIKQMGNIYILQDTYEDFVLNGNDIDMRSANHGIISDTTVFSFSSKKLQLENEQVFLEESKVIEPIRVTPLYINPSKKTAVATVEAIEPESNTLTVTNSKIILYIDNTFITFEAADLRTESPRIFVGNVETTDKSDEIVQEKNTYTIRDVSFIVDEITRSAITITLR